jgi:nucleoside-triphosphatase
VGKSTLIMRVFETLKASNPTLKVQGFYTRKHLFLFLHNPSPIPKTIQWFVLFVGEVRLAGERVGFEVVTLDGRTCPLASSNFSRFCSSLPC